MLVNTGPGIESYIQLSVVCIDMMHDAMAFCDITNRDSVHGKKESHTFFWTNPNYIKIFI